MSKVENWDDKNFVLEQVQKNGSALEFASARLKDDEKVVMAAVKRDGTALEYASDRLKDNKEIVMAAVIKDGRALYDASDKLKDNEEVVMVAVQNKYYVLIYASARLRSDINFCIECAKIDKNSSKYFLGEAKELFETHHNDVVAVEQQQKQNKTNEFLLNLLKKLSIKKKLVNTTNVFKRKLDV